MIESIFKDLTSATNNNSELMESNSDVSELRDDSKTLINSLPIIQKIVSRKVFIEAGDIVQKIVIRLLKWQNKYQNKSEKMSEDEWNSFAARTAYNEINRFYSKQPNINVSLESALEISSSKSVEGESVVEVISLVNFVWQEICSLSLRQKRALLLSSQDLIIYFLKCEISDEDLAENLSLKIEEWIKIKEKLPLSDIQIAELWTKMNGQKEVESIAKSVKKARHEARQKLRRLIEK